MTNVPTIRSIGAFCYRYPLETPVETSFGRMLDRPAVFVRIEDTDGTVGWGEAWSNFPSVGAEHRARIINEILAPAATGFAAGEPASLFQHLTDKFAVLALQTGEHGPFAQCIAGIDLAMWDLHAKRKSLPLWHLLGGQRSTIKVYARRARDPLRSSQGDLQPQRYLADLTAGPIQLMNQTRGLGASRNRRDIEAWIEILRSRRRILDVGIGHEEVGYLLQPFGDRAIGIHLLPFLRCEHLLRLERFVDV